MVKEVQTTAELCDESISQYREARVAVREWLGGSAMVGTAGCLGSGGEAETLGLLGEGRIGHAVAIGPMFERARAAGSL